MFCGICQIFSHETSAEKTVVIGEEIFILANMKYQQGKIKREHHTLREFDEFLHACAKLNYVQRLIPWRISRQQKGSSHCMVTFSYPTTSWGKCIMKKGSTAQELFVIMAPEHIDTFVQRLEAYNQEHE